RRRQRRHRHPGQGDGRSRRPRPGRTDHPDHPDQAPRAIRQGRDPEPQLAGGPAMTAPAYAETVEFGPDYSSRHGARIRNWLLHTEQGDASAASLAAYCRNPARQVSYHYIARDGEVHCPVDTDYSAWAVLDANPYTINACFAGSYAEWSRPQWL